MARRATDSVVNVKRSLSQISPRVRVARRTAAAFHFVQVARRASGVPGPLTHSTSRVSAALALYRSSRMAARAMLLHRSSRGSTVIRSRSRVICSRSVRSK